MAWLTLTQNDGIVVINTQHIVAMFPTDKNGMRTKIRLVATGAGTVPPAEVKEDLSTIVEALEKLGENGVDLRHP